MDSPIGTSPRKRRFGRPGVGAAAAGPLTWLQKHPGAAAALYMLIGGCIGTYVSHMGALWGLVERVRRLPVIQSAAEPVGGCGWGQNCTRVHMSPLLGACILSV
jgi:hypothetical protein